MNISYDRQFKANLLHTHNKWLYEGCSANSRTVLLSKHTVTIENQNYYEVVQPLRYIAYCGFIYDVVLW